MLCTSTYSRVTLKLVHSTLLWSECSFPSIKVIGTTGITCTRKIDYSCEHCGATNHFKPLCYAYIREVAQARLQAGDQKTEVKKVVPQVQAASTYPSFAQAYNLLKANAAQLQRKSAASTAQPTFMVQSTGLPMGPTEQVKPTSQ